jgi:EAL domain-containing protein (putative c-di-GMP-specific phosphodiesterase class I)
MRLLTPIARQVRRAMARGELALFCQPWAGCDSGGIRGAEALIRWRHPTRGLLAPAEWLPAITPGPLSTPFNLHVLALALGHQDRWREEGVSIPLSVNISPACLTDERFVSGAERLFADRSPAGVIRLEITEHATVEGDARLDESIARLRAHGFEFMLDDFGAEYSSLSRLASLPFSTLKIDGSLIEGMSTTRAHRSIIHASIHLAHTLGLNAIAERVEDIGTWKLLQALGCDEIQGFHVSRPMPAEEIPAFLRGYLARPPGARERALGAEERRSRFVQRSDADRRSGRDRRTPVPA